MDDVKNAAADAVEADRVFSRPMGDVADFRFNGQVATVFDDMVSRSVPFYAETQRMITEIAADYAVPGTRVYDFGCATGTTFEALDPVLPAGVEFVGIDSSHEMLDRCRMKLDAAGLERTLSLECADLNQGAAIENASVALMILTLQFIRPLNRERLIRDVHRGLNGNGCLILVEKVLGEDSLFNRQFIKYYYDFKRRNGYSELEIAQKREALENVLVPYRLEENKDLLKNQGFRHVDVFFKWYNFCGIIATR